MMNEKKVVGNITISHKYALLLSTETYYYILFKYSKCSIGHKEVDNINFHDFCKKYIGNIDVSWTVEEFKEVFGLPIDLVKNIACGSYGQSKVFTELEDKIIQSTRKFISANLEIISKLNESFPDEHFLHDSMLFSKGDFQAIDHSMLDNEKYEKISHLVGESAVFDVAGKLGLHDNVKAVYEVIDKERNVIPKSNCGYILSRENAEKIYEAAKGVYLLITPTTTQDYPAVRFLTMRVSHVMPNQFGVIGGASIRVKVNVPNIHSSDKALRYQYRGELIPVNEESGWTVQLGQVPYTVNLEESILKEKKKMIEPTSTITGTIDDDYYPINFSDAMQIQFYSPLKTYPTCGLLSSFSQRRTKYHSPMFRLPYSAVVIAVHIMNDSFSKEEMNFMRFAIGQVNNIDQANKYFEDLQDSGTCSLSNKNIESIEEAINIYKGLYLKFGDKMCFKCPNIAE